MGGNRSLNKALNLEAVKAAAGLTARLREGSRSSLELVEQLRNYYTPIKGKWSSETGSFLVWNYRVQNCVCCKQAEK
jgi:hypothetical protein